MGDDERRMARVRIGVKGGDGEVRGCFCGLSSRWSLDLSPGLALTLHRTAASLVLPGHVHLPTHLSLHLPHPIQLFFSSIVLYR